MAPLDLARIKERASFKPVLSRYGIRLRGAGPQRYALCPFHQETRPSCGFHLEKKVFHCFGCGAKGTILDFVARMEGIPLWEAAALVVECCGIALEGCESAPGSNNASTAAAKAASRWGEAVHGASRRSPIAGGEQAALLQAGSRPRAPVPCRAGPGS